MKLTDLDATFVRYTDNGGHRAARHHVSCSDCSCHRWTQESARYYARLVTDPAELERLFGALLTPESAVVRTRMPEGPQGLQGGGQGPQGRNR